MFTREETIQMIEWVREHTINKGLIPVNPMTAMGLVEAFWDILGWKYQEKLFYAMQAVDKAICQFKNEGYL